MTNNGKPGPPGPSFMQTGNGTPIFGETNIPFPPSEPSFTGTTEPFNPFGTNPLEPTPPTPDVPQKYTIFDLFWLLNTKYSVKEGPRPIQNEAQFVTVSFNASFGNLRIVFYELMNNSIQGNIVYLENLKKLVIGTIYPSSAFNAYYSETTNMICLEQLFKQIPGAEWQKNRPICHIEKNTAKLRLSIKEQERVYFYDFDKWQRDAFLYACYFAITTGFELTGKLHINRRNE